MEATALESVDAVTPEWMTAVLAQNGIAATVRRVTTEPVGTGQMGSCYRLFIGYDAGVGPDRLIVKLPATDAASRAAGQLGYRCETTFYREVADRLHLDIPRCYFAAMNECGDGFTLVLEDLAPASRATRSPVARSIRLARPRLMLLVCTLRHGTTRRFVNSTGSYQISRRTRKSLPRSWWTPPSSFWTATR